MLNRSRLAWTRRFPGSLNSFDSRKSSWFNLSPYIVPGSISCTDAVPFTPAPRLRPSDGAISAFVYTRVAEIIGPGRLWNAAEVCIPPHGSGYTASSLSCVWNGGGDLVFPQAGGGDGVKESPVEGPA